MATALTLVRSRSADVEPLPASRVLVSANASQAASYAEEQRRIRWPLVVALALLHALLFAAIAMESHDLRASRRHESVAVTIVPGPRPLPPPDVPPKPLAARKLAPIPAMQPPTVVVPDLPHEVAQPTITLPPESPAPAPVVAALPVAPIAAAPTVAPMVPPRFDASYLDNPAPAYPTMSRRQHEEGRVLLRVLVAADGRAESVEIATSSGFERLDRAALDAVRRWRFVPARRGGDAVAATVNVPIAFALDRG